MKNLEDTDFKIFDALEKRRTDIFKRICKGDIPENFNVPKLDLLKGLDLTGIHCTDLAISNFDLTETNFSKATLGNIVFNNVILNKTNFKQADMKNLSFKNTDTGGAIIDIEQIPLLPLTDKQRYERFCLELESCKDPEIYADEHKAIKKFMEVLDTEIETQNRLKRLTIEQLQILFPYFYV